MESGFLYGPRAGFQDAVSSQGRKAGGSPALDVGSILAIGPTREEWRFPLGWRKV